MQVFGLTATPHFMTLAGRKVVVNLLLLKGYQQVDCDDSLFDELAYCIVMCQKKGIH
jgi:hypothetical protein